MHTPVYTPELVINWHITEACNYSCHYCYAAWAKPDHKREIIHDSGKVTQLLRELYDFFHPQNNSNPLTQKLRWNTVRLNFAGGEPLLYSDRISHTAQQAKKLGFNISMITNGSELDQSLLEMSAKNMSWLGISIDSESAITNGKIGRLDRRGKLLNTDTLSRDIKTLRQLHPAFGLKLNTVVNQLNWQEDMGNLVKKFSPDKWKILRMLPVINNDLAVTDKQFESFIHRHESLAEIACIEDNDDMRDSYIMLDPHGRFFQNSNAGCSSGYQYSRSIIDWGIDLAFSDVNFSSKGFSERYLS